MARIAPCRDPLLCPPSALCLVVKLGTDVVFAIGGTLSQKRAAMKTVIEVRPRPVLRTHGRQCRAPDC